MGEFQRDIATAGDQDSLGQLLQMKRLVRGDAQFAAGNDMGGAHLAGGAVARGDQDFFRRDALAGIQQQ